MEICVILWFLPQGIEHVPVFELIKEVGKLETGFEEFKRAAKVLDSVYIPTRYPSGIAGDLSPSEYCEQEDAKECIRYAESILGRVKGFTGK